MKVIENPVEYAKSAVEAYTALYGADLGQIAFRLAAAAVLSLVFFLLGAILFQWKVLSAAKSSI